MIASANQPETRLAATPWHLDQLTPFLPPPHCPGATSLALAFADKLVPPGTKR